MMLLTEPLTVTVGLIVFVVVLSLDLLGLLYDLFRYLMGWTTISMWVWAYPWWGLPLLALQAAGIAGLAVHFYAF